MRYILEQLSGCCFFKKGLIRHLIIGKNEKIGSGKKTKKNK